ncbi:ABC transporter permease [Persicimonas caeni]|uniref:ABC transporter permease n=1 Tax=Persicimonas caeni TaxID=2292766 RepID=A0A4Y6PSG7_PERCE|nr:FtsX-like permease family protein [Persicimonas caeni]QDG50957.1 ABC transporter permease [Persicimonas caeni]QED32178.1 ABC transporter permease [Persicimonas caeni]
MLKLAWRNLWRNRPRTLIICSAIILSYALMLVSMGISEDTYTKMLDAAAEGAGGEVLVHGDGWWETQSSDIVIERPQAAQKALEGVAGIDAVIPRVVINGLATSSRGNEPVRLMGVDLDQEAKLADLTEDLDSGEFFSDEFDHPIVLSEKLVDKLGLERGDKVVLTASTPDGEVTRALFRLDGILDAAGMGESMAYTTLAAAQKAVSMEGQLTQFGLLTDEAVAHEQVAERAKTALEGRGLEVLTWQEAVPEMVGFIQMDEAFGYIYMIVVFIVVVFAIANTFLMAVMERVREFGLLNAIGMTPGRVGKLIFWETALMATISIAIGFGIGLGIHLYIADVGINTAEMYGVDMELAGVNMSDMIMRSEINPVKWLGATATVFLSVMLSAAYPAWRASQMAPAEAMRFYE